MKRKVPDEPESPSLFCSQCRQWVPAASEAVKKAYGPDLRPLVYTCFDCRGSQALPSSVTIEEISNQEFRRQSTPYRDSRPQKTCSVTQRNSSEKRGGFRLPGSCPGRPRKHADARARKRDWKRRRRTRAKAAKPVRAE